MAFDVLALMQDADHVKGVRTFPDINHMRAGPRLAGSRAQIDRTTDHLSGGKSQADPVHLFEIAIGLLRVPMLGGVVPDPGKIGTGGRGEAEELCHPARPARSSALKAARSRGSGGPEASPSSSAAWRARTRASCSSSSRSPARTTSLAEP